jgi:hypothetical protein
MLSKERLVSDVNASFVACGMTASKAEPLYLVV